MRCGWLIVAISSLVWLVPVARLSGQEAADGKVVAKKIALPPAQKGPANQSRPLADLAVALESGQFEIPAEASAEEILQYIHQLSELSRDLATDYRSVQASITRAQGQAAEKLLDGSVSLSDEDYYLVAKLGLSARISQIPSSDLEEQRVTLALVVRQLEIGARQGLRMDEIRNVIRTAEYLERHADRGLALNACAQFSEIIRATNNARYDETLLLLENTSRRLELVGQTFELTGTTVDGNPIRWSDYRNKVVLVNFWASWSVPCVAEIRQLKRYYELYREMGFEIVGVSLDSDRAELEAVIAKEEIPWINLYQEGAGLDHPMAVKYGVRSIPTVLLIDEHGKVVSSYIRGSELDRQLNRVFGPESSLATDLAAESRWAETASELQRLVTANPSKIDYRIALGAAQLLDDDPLGYAGTCQASWLAVNRQDATGMAMSIPLYCLPAEHRLNRNEVYEIATALRAESSANVARLAVILSAFRSGRDDVCLEEEIVDGDEFTMAIAALTQAQAARRAGKSELTASLMIEARRIVAFRFSDYFIPAASELPYEHWICCAVAKLMLAEAEAAMNAEPASTSLP